jgi:hypothetical protein
MEVRGEAVDQKISQKVKVRRKCACTRLAGERERREEKGKKK